MARGRKAWVEVKPGGGRGTEFRWTLHLPDGKQVRSFVGYQTERSAWQGWRRYRSNVGEAYELR